MTKRLTAAMLLVAALALSGCDSSEKRAEEHFQAALELIDQGDTKRAILEMRNALQLVPNHEQARQKLAELRRDEGDIPEAVSNYRKLVEDHPENGAGQLALAQLALEIGDWKAAETHGTRAGEILGDTPEVKAIKANLAYRDALQKEDREAREAVAKQAADLVATDPALLNARRIVIDNLLRAEEWSAALDQIDAGIAQDPERSELYHMRLGVLEQLGRLDDITKQLEDMVERFPKEEELPLRLTGWYIKQGDLTTAEAFLRKRADAAPDNQQRQTELVSFLNQTKGAEAASAELQRLAEVGGQNTAIYRAMRANLMFQNGERDATRAELESILADMSEEDAKKTTADDIRVDLARMTALAGDTKAAQALIATVLQNDPTKISALKMQGAWQIEEDKVEDAIATLRTALRESPRDAQVMTLLAAAHERAGAPDLQREMLALAMETSQSAPDETMRYAQFLMGQERFRPAEDVLVEALRLHRDNVGLYSMLGSVYVATADWTRAEQVAESLNQLAQAGKDPNATPALNTLKAQILAGQKKDTDLLSFLDQLSNEKDAGLTADVAIIRTYAARGDMAKARERLDAALAKNPKEPMLRLLSAGLRAAEHDFTAANTEMESIVTEFPNVEPAWMALYRLKLVEGDRESASKVLDRALTALPDGGSLLFTRATELEAQGQIDEAIGIYETLYQRNSANELVANNLASLLSMHRSDNETMQRAYRVSRRLQDSSNPALRDTYGWIAARLDRLEEAEKHLKFAVDGIPNHPVVQYHYAVVLAKLGRNDEALEHFRKAVDLAGTLLPAADLEAAKSEIARLEAAPASPTAPAAPAAPTPPVAPAAGQ